MKVLIEYDEDSGDVQIGCEPDMTGNDLSDWLMAIASGLYIEEEINRGNSFPPTMMQ